MGWNHVVIETVTIELLGRGEVGQIAI